MGKNKTALENKLQIGPELAGLSTNLISGACGSSASRGQMEGGQRAQILVLNKPDYPETYTGVEQEYAKYTFAPRAPFDAEVVGSVNKYNEGLSAGSYRFNPCTLTILRDTTRRRPRYDLLEVPMYKSFHNNFGYMLQKRESYRKIYQQGAILRKGEVIADSPGVSKEGFYRYGKLTNMCFMTSAFVTEDGYWASNEWCDDAAATGIGFIIINMPKGSYLTHAYGTKDNPRYIPTIGEKIRPDGLVAALREYDPITAIHEMTPDGLREIDYTFDEPKFIEGSFRNATVIDIDVVLNEQELAAIQPTLLDENGNPIANQLNELWAEQRRAAKDLVELAKKCMNAHPEDNPPEFGGRMTEEVYNALHICGEPLVTYGDRGRNKERPKPIKFMNYGTPLASGYIKITYKYDVIPEIGAKIAGDFGNKGILCRKTPRSWMPLDHNGFYSDLVGHANAIINRMIPVTLDYHFLGAQSMVREKEIRELAEDGKWDEAFELISKVYSVVMPRAYRETFIPYMTTRERRINHVKAVLNNHLMYEIRQDDTPNYIQLTEALQKNFPYVKKPVEFTSVRGIRKRTKLPVMIGRLYIRVLEKTGHDWGAVDSPTRQAHGIAAKIGHRDRHSRSWRKQPYRYGEAEIRLIVGVVGAAFAADLLDRANNPTVQEEINRIIMEAKRPSDIHQIVDRKRFRVGESVTHQYLNNALYTMGAKFIRIHKDYEGE